MKIYLIAEDHVQHEKTREATIPHLVKLGYIVGKEGFFYPDMQGGVYGLEDPLYNIYPEVAMSYISACEGNMSGVDYALEQLEQICNFLNSDSLEENPRFPIKIKNPDKDCTKELLARLINLLSRGTIDSAWITAILNDIKYLQNIVNNYYKNELFLGEISGSLDTYYDSLKMERFLDFSKMDRPSQFAFADKVLSELRNIPIIYYIGILLKDAATVTPQKDVVIIIGKNHLNMGEFMAPIIKMGQINGIELMIQQGYDEMIQILRGDYARIKAASIATAPTPSFAASKESLKDSKAESKLKKVAKNMNLGGAIRSDREIAQQKSILARDKIHDQDIRTKDRAKINIRK